MTAPNATATPAPSAEVLRLDGSQPGFLTEAARYFYDRQGFLIVDNALPPETLDRLRDEATAICRGDRGDYKGWVGPHDGQTDAEVLRQYLCIHFPHKISPFMADMLALPAMVETLVGLIGPDVKCCQSMLFIKSAGKPGQAWHQDEDYIPTRDRSLCGGWMALDDATIENGCLWVLPGSHRPGVLYPQSVQSDDRFDCADESGGFPYRDEDAIPVEVKAGSMVFFNGYLLHRSLPNRQTTGFRRVLVNHYLSASSLLPWIQDIPHHETFIDHHRNVAKADVRDIVMIAGKDPYAYLGTEDRFKAHVRPSGEGGCAKGVAGRG